MYRSFYEALSELPDEQRLRLYDAIMRYSLDGIEPQLTGLDSAVFKLIKPQIDANSKRYENGKKGGRPEKNNQEETKPKPNNNQTETNTEPNKNDNVNENGNVNQNENENLTPLASQDPLAGGSDPPPDEIFYPPKDETDGKPDDKPEKPQKRPERLEKFMEKTFPENPKACPQDWGESAVEAALRYRPQTKTDFEKQVNWHFEKFYSHFAGSGRSNASKRDWKAAWLNWWKTEFEKIAQQEQRDELFLQKKQRA